MTGGTAIRRAGIIAAGQGVRLRHGAGALKPLVPVAGVTLVERVLTSLAEVGPTEVVIIVNEESVAVRDHVSSRRWPFEVRWLVETTPSSMHSFLRVVETLAAADAGEPAAPGHNAPFLISTVDTVAAPGSFAAFMEASAALELVADVTLAVTPPTDDEKPLLVKLDPGSSRVVAIGAAAAGSEWATAGYYSVRASVLQEADEARRSGITALRLFLGRLQDRGYTLAAVPVSGGVDVDRPGDVGVAEQFLRQAGA